MRDKGFSLIELVIAMGIGSIVLLMVSVMLVRGTNLFRAGNDDVNMRNDYQIVRNQIDEAIREAKMLIVEKQGEDIIIYTGEVNEGSREFTTSSTDRTTEKVIIYDKSEASLYVLGEYEEPSATGAGAGKKWPEGNRICDIVKDFNVELDDSSKRVEKNSVGDDVVYYANPVRVNVTLALENKNSDVASTFSINMRNRLKSIVVYTTIGYDVLLNSGTIVEYNVK